MADDTSPWMKTLSFFTLVQSMIFVVVVFLQFNRFHDIQELDVKLKTKIQNFYDNKDTDGPQTRDKRATSSFFADILAAQEQALARYCIHPDHTCSAGDSGDQGHPGYQGLKGSKGETGESGSIGDPGPLGPGGEIGDQGVIGEIGDNGLKGTKGALGLKGGVGDPGTKGLQGIIGDKGPKGVAGGAGETGSPGPKGIKGAAGQSGDRGLTGDNGAVGVKGDIGPTGPPGQDTKMLPDNCPCQAGLSAPAANETIFMADGTDKLLPCTGQLTLLPPTTSRKGLPTRRGLQHLLGNGSYVIQNAVSADYGIYQCSQGGTTNYITVERGTLPSIYMHPLSSPLAIGSQINFECQSSGTPQPTIEFYKDGVKITSDATHILRNNGQLVLTSPTGADRGWYECRATNDVGTGISVPWHMT